LALVLASSLELLKQLLYCSIQRDGAKGLGTAAKVGAMAIAYANGEKMIGTAIASDNVAAKRSSEKVGFRQDTSSHVFPTGPEGRQAEWDYWLAFNPIMPHPNDPPEMVLASQETFTTTFAKFKIDT
jgi:hypothetical protein